MTITLSTVMCAGAIVAAVFFTFGLVLGIYSCVRREG